MITEKTCPYLMYNGNACGRELYDNEHCIFHSENITEKKETFNNVFFKEFERQKNEEKIIDFTGFKFPDSIQIMKQKIEKIIYFNGAIFFSYVEFLNFTFTKEAQFIGVIFNDYCSFKFSIFKGKSDFFKAIFKKEAHFEGVHFKKSAFFNGSNFNSKAHFLKTNFSGSTGFVRVTFNTEVDFTDAVFLLNTSFENSNILGTIALSNCVLRDVDYLFDILKNKGLKRVIKGKYRIKNFKFHISDKAETKYPIIHRLTKDAWYLDDFKKNHPGVFFLWKISSNCGRWFSLWALWSFIFSLYFAMNFYLIDYSFTVPFKLNPELVSKSFWTFFYYSIVTFTTLGFGDIVPNTFWSQFYVILEVITGYVMLGGLISIFANKLARRS